MENNQSVVLGSNRVKDIVITGLLIALVFIATTFINFRSPVSVGGLIHLGNTMLFMSAIVFGKNKGAIAGAFGMGLFDVMSGWMIWAPFTFVVRGVMGYIIGYIANTKGRNGTSLFWNMVAIIIAGMWMLIGYYATEVILYGHYLLPIKSIPGNIVQIVIGIIVGLPLTSVIKRIKF